MIKINSATPRRQVHFLDDAVSKAKIWIKDVQQEIGLDTQTQAFSCLAAVLHTLRDRLSVQEAVDLGAQLPALIRGMYYQGWRPSNATRKVRDVPEFVDYVAHQFRNGIVPGGYDPIAVTQGILKVIERRISSGEIEDIKASLPNDLLKLWSQPGELTEQPSVETESSEATESSLGEDLDAESSWQEDEPVQSGRDVMAWDQPD